MWLAVACLNCRGQRVGHIQDYGRAVKIGRTAAAKQPRSVIRKFAYHEKFDFHRPTNRGQFRALGFPYCLAQANRPGTRNLKPILSNGLMERLRDSNAPTSQFPPHFNWNKVALAPNPRPARSKYATKIDRPSLLRPSRLRGVAVAHRTPWQIPPKEARHARQRSFEDIG